MKSFSRDHRERVPDTGSAIMAVGEVLKMNADEWGEVIVAVKIENLFDLYAVDRKHIDASEVRSIEIDDAVVDTSAIGLEMPLKLIEQLGLNQTGTRPVRTDTGVRQCRVFDPVKLTLQGRECILDVTEDEASDTVVLGMVPLGLMDFVVDPREQRVISNPAHGGREMYDMFSELTAVQR